MATKKKETKKPVTDDEEKKKTENRMISGADTPKRGDFVLVFGYFTGR